MSAERPIRGPFVVVAIAVGLSAFMLLTFPGIFMEGLIYPTLAVLTTLVLVVLWKIIRRKRS